LELESDPTKGQTHEAEEVSEEQVIGILKEAEAGAVVQSFTAPAATRASSNLSQNPRSDHRLNRL
jgi:hypothetical protein